MISRTDVCGAPDEMAAALRQYVREHPDLIYDEYAPDDEHSLEGACYLLSETYFHAMGGQDSGLTIHCLSWDDVTDHDTTATHWFLRDGETVVDLGLDTLEQADHIPYDAATRRAFITGYEPSNRCERVLDALNIAY